ncbi:MAG TPA: c-type cytochrome, partial [Tepidisphaeraceae bacterium]|nr:c-type cytochrome [Tepidisphaeraceae bacterium]
AVANTGKGSPTGVTFAYTARFPAKYQHALYACDWAYGTLYAVHIAPQGAGYTGTFEPFAVAKGWDVTDVVVGNDGAMYVTIGGRGTQSGLYRITYTGPENTTPAAPQADAATAQARETRRKLESFHGRQDPAAVSTALPLLNSPDRYLRFAARVALESQPVDSWKDQVLNEKRPTALINGTVGLIRAAATAPPELLTNAQQVTKYAEAGKVLQPAILDALNRLDLKRLSEEQQLELIRAYDLAFIRMGRPPEPAGQVVAARIDAIFPSPSPAVNREAVQLLAYLGSQSVITKGLALMSKATTQEDQFHYAFVLRNVPAGWTLDQRKAYFAWVNHATANYKGGNSFKKFLARMKDDAAKSLTDQERVALDTVLKGDVTAVAVKTMKPRQFVRNWQMQDLLPEIDQASAGRDFERGKEVYEAAQCAACHRFGQDGGATGPDLTGVGNRFNPVDSLEAILLPSKVISDQYQTYLVETTDGDMNTGRITYEDDNKLDLATNPFSTDVLSIPKKELKSKSVAKMSMMPPGLVDNFTKEEIFDLIAYLRSGGDPKDKAFAPK